MRSPIYLREPIEADRDKGRRSPHIEFSPAPVAHSPVMLCSALVAGASLIAVPSPNSTVLDIFSLRPGSTDEKLGNAKDLVGQVGTHSPAL